jgi:D-threo-aldose 1-dehydrogenase
MTDIWLPRFGYGAANVGNLYRAMTDDEASLLLETAWDLGIRYFDTAPHYGLGLSERRLGKFLSTKPRNEYVVSTKVGRLLRPNPLGAGLMDTANDFAVPADTTRVWDFTAGGIRRSIEESLDRTGLDRFDIVYLHDPERHRLSEGVDHALPALAQLRDEKLVSAIGVGSMTTSALLDVVNTGLLDLVMIAGRYTLADQSALDEVVPACRHHGVGIVIAAVFNSGLLASDTPGAGGRYDYADVPASLLDRVQLIARVCRDFGVSLPTAALHYPARDDAVRCVVVGGSRPDQLRQNAARMTEVVPAELWQALAGQSLIPAATENHS